MKRTSIQTLMLCMVVAAASCSKEAPGEASAGGTGILEMNISTTRAEADGVYDPKEHLVVRIYNSRDELIRKYTSETFVKQLELFAGEYRIAVEAGEVVPASFSKRFYRGEERFTVTPGQTTRADVLCRRQNTAAEVRFDATVAAAFGTDFRFWIVADETFDAAKAEEGAVPALKYTSDAVGYFTLPEGVTTLAWHFEGTHPERGQIVQEGRQEHIQAGGKYVFTCQFSKDLPGYLQCVVIRVDASSDNQDDTIIFSPDPTVEGDGFDIALPQGYIPGQPWTRTYKLAAMAPLKSAELDFGGRTIDLTNAPAEEGLAVVRENDLSLTVTLSEAFLAGCPAGSHTASFRITDTKEARAAVSSELRVQGMLAVEESDYDLWANTVTLRAMVVDPNAAAVTFGLKNGGSWLEKAGTADAEGCYSATFAPEWAESTNEAGITVYTPKAGTGIWAGGSYEFRVVVGDNTTYATNLTAAAGQVISGGDMEDGTMNCFDNNHGSFWDSGNNSMSDPLCSQSTFTGMQGSSCAKLTANKPVLLVNLAAGNLFTGVFELATPSGKVHFGQAYEWQARPKALSVLYYAETLGAVNQNQHNGPLATGAQDQARIFAAIVDWGARHTVTSGNKTPTGVWDPAKGIYGGGEATMASGKIIAYGSLFITEQSSGGEMIPVEIPIQYYDTTAKPSGQYSLVISCATSAYGDYMNGCTTNVMYVDDFEWVY